MNYTDMARMVCWTVGGYLVLDGAGEMPHAFWPRILSTVGLTLLGLALIKR
jgi:hypothetical protein